MFSPYSLEMGKTVLRAIAAKRSLRGAKFLMLQDSPGEGMQAYIFKKFYWWEPQQRGGAAPPPPPAAVKTRSRA